MMEPIDATLPIAGALGALIRLSFGERMGFIGAALSVMGGITCAIYLAPAAVWYLEIPERLSGAAGFLAGALYLHIFHLAWHYIDGARKDPEGLVNIIKGKKP